MNNKERGEVTIKAGEKSYTLRFSNKHLCALEDDMDMDFQTILALFDGRFPSMNYTRIMFRRGLVEHHGEMDYDAVSEIIDNSDFTALMEGILTAISLAFPSTSGSKKKKSPASGDGKSL